MTAFILLNQDAGRPFNEKVKDAHNILAENLVKRAIMKTENSSLLYVFVSLDDEGQKKVIKDAAIYIGNVQRSDRHD